MNAGVAMKVNAEVDMDVEGNAYADMNMKVDVKVCVEV